jgi:hypothetical protein
MKHTMVYFGNMTHGTFSINGDEIPTVIIHSIDEKSIIDPDSVDEIMHLQGFDSYLIPDEFTGEIVFSRAFFKGLSE